MTFKLLYYVPDMWLLKPHISNSVTSLVLCVLSLPGKWLLLLLLANCMDFL